MAWSGSGYRLFLFFSFSLVKISFFAAKRSPADWSRPGLLLEALDAKEEMTLLETMPKVICAFLLVDVLMT